MSGNGKILRIAIFPWLAFGHMIPFLELAQLIAQKGHKIFFISTPRNIQRLPKVPPHLSQNFTFVSLPLNQVHNLPQNAEATSDLRLHQIPYLKLAYDGLQSSLSEFLRSSSPDWIIYDFAPYWLPPIAARLGLFSAFFSIFPAWTMTFFGCNKVLIDEEEDDEPRNKPEHFTVPPKWVTFPSVVAFKIHEAKRLIKQMELNESGVTDSFRVECIMKGCDVICVRTCAELESKYITLLSETNSEPVVPIGLLPPSEFGDDGNDAWLVIKQFLDAQAKGTTLVVAFGSELELSQEEISELAYGLELSGVPFIWTLKKSYSLELPEGFEVRVKARGLVWTGWAPQPKIMAHESVGGFVTHCGGSSIIEAICFGIPLIMMPFEIDTGLNARVYEDKKVGVEVDRDEEDGSFSRESVAESIRLVVLEKEGEIYRENAKKLRSLFADKELHNGYVDRFVEFLQNYKR